MQDFQLFFTADGLNYCTTISASTDGQAQDKFTDWFTQILKPQRGIVGVARVTKIVPIDRKEKAKKTLWDYLKFWK